MAAISMDLRVRVFDARQSGDTTAEVAERFAVSPAFVRRLMQRYRQTGSLAPAPGRRRGPAPALADRADDLRRLVADHPDATPAELRDRLGADVSPLTVWRMLRRLGLTHKKSRPGRPSRIAPTSGRPATGGPRRSPAAGPTG